MSESIPEQKSQLRQACRELRKSMGEEARGQTSLSICERIENWHLFQQSKTILTYMPMRSEVNLSLLLDRHPQKHWILPRILPEENHRMVFHPYKGSRLIRHSFGMAEPAPDSMVIPSGEIELALVPGLGFDRRGWRLGYGGGYYDRFLKEFNGRSAGIVFQALLLDNVPHSLLDVPMHWIVTEDELFVTSREDRHAPPTIERNPRP